MKDPEIKEEYEKLATQHLIEQLEEIKKEIPLVIELQKFDDFEMSELKALSKLSTLTSEVIKALKAGEQLKKEVESKLEEVTLILEITDDGSNEHGTPFLKEIETCLITAIKRYDESL